MDITLWHSMRWNGLIFSAAHCSLHNTHIAHCMIHILLTAWYTYGSLHDTHIAHCKYTQCSFHDTHIAWYTHCSQHERHIAHCSAKLVNTIWPVFELPHFLIGFGNQLPQHYHHCSLALKYAALLLSSCPELDNPWGGWFAYSYTCCCGYKTNSHPVGIAQTAKGKIWYNCTL